MESVFDAKLPQIVGMQSSQARHTLMPVNAHISKVIFNVFCDE